MSSNLACHFLSELLGDAHTQLDSIQKIEEMDMPNFIPSGIHTRILSFEEKFEALSQTDLYFKIFSCYLRLFENIHSLKKT